jgi:ABC-type glycerol-3-phosphate transport system substrate-binding protein
MRKKHGLLLSALAFSLMLTACGSKKDATTTTSADTDSKNYVYKQELLDFLNSDEDFTNVAVVDDVIYLETTVYGEGTGSYVLEDEVLGSEQPLEEGGTAASDAASDTEQEDYTADDEEDGSGVSTSTVSTITAYTLDGTVKGQFTLPMDNAYHNCLNADSEGNIYLIETQYATYEGDDTQDKYYLLGYTLSGEEIFRTQLGTQMSEDDYYYVNRLYCLEDGTLALKTGQGVEIYDKSGSQVREIESSGDTDDLFQMQDGKLAYTIYGDNDKFLIQTLDPATGEYGDQTELPFYLWRYDYTDGGGYDLLLSDESGVYGYNIGDAQITKVMDFIASDFDFYSIRELTALEDGSFFGYVYTDEGREFCRFVKVPAEEIQDKTTLTLGCYYLDSTVKSKIIAFNKNSENCRINVEDYSEYNTADDFTVGITRMNTDIASGNIPDIMVFDSSSEIPINSYVAKGLFTDLNPLIENDPEFNREDYLSNIFDLFTTDGKMYQIIPSFYAVTVEVKTSDVQGKTHWTMDEAQEILASKPEGTKLFSDLTRSTFLWYNLWTGGNQYVDWENKECHFDTDNFIKVLEYAATLPEEIDSSQYEDDSYWEEYDAQWRTGKTLASYSGITEFRDYSYAKYATFGEDVTFIGMPTEEGSGSAINYETGFSISEQCQNKEAAWEFIKGFFTEEAQEEDNYYFPVRISSLEKKEQEAWKNPTYTDENGNEVEYYDTYYVNGEEVEAQPLTPEETGMIKDFLMSLDTVAGYDDSILNIINEEADSYFSGQKTVQEVVDIIQNRVKVYINENS